MGYLSDVIDGIKSARKSVDNAVSGFNDARNEIIPNARTIAGRSLDGTLQFPMLISDTIPIDSAATLARIMERVYASFVQTVISMNSTIDISSDKTPAEFLKRFHRNVKKLESVNVAAFDKKSGVACVIESDSIPTTQLLKHHKELLEVTNPSQIRGIPQVGNNTFYEADLPPVSQLASNMSSSSRITAKDRFNKGGQGDTVSVLKDSDVKKENDLQPYAMNVKLMAINGKQEFVHFMNFVMGVKVVLHPIRSDEIISNISRAISNNGFMFNLIRWTTGEKSLFGDILFNINDVKLDAANKSKGASGWWQTLKRMKERKLAYNSLFTKNRMIPNSTLVITDMEVSQIRDTSGYDLGDPKTALKLINALFLMGMIIVSDSTETFKVIYADAGEDYQYYSLDLVEKDTQVRSNKIGREIVKMIGKS